MVQEAGGDRRDGSKGRRRRRPRRLVWVALVLVVLGVWVAYAGVQLLHARKDAQVGIDTTLLDYTVDKNPLKQGMFTPGTRLPVRGADTLAADRPDYVLLLAWNFADEIIDQQHEYAAGGGRFLVPVPEPRVVDSPA